MKLIKKTKIDISEKEKIFSFLKKFLEEEPPVIFAYFYGSFIKGNEFNDIDIAVYVKEDVFKDEYSLFSYGINLATRIESALKGYKVDVRLLNLAPLSFKFQVITKGNLIFSKDKKKLINFLVLVRGLYFDFKPHLDFYYNKMVLGE